MKLQKFIAIILILLLTFLSFQTSYAQVNNEALKFAIKQKAFEIAVGKSLVAGGLAVSSYNTMKDVVSDTIVNMGETASEFRDSFIDNTTNTIKLWGVVGSTVWSGVKSVVSNIIDRLSITEDIPVEYLPQDVTIESTFDPSLTGINAPSSFSFSGSSQYIYGSYNGNATAFNTGLKTNEYSVISGFVNFDPTKFGVQQNFTLTVKSKNTDQTYDFPGTLFTSNNSTTWGDGSHRNILRISVTVAGRTSYTNVTSPYVQSFEYLPISNSSTIVEQYNYNGELYTPSGTIAAKAPAFNPSWDFENRNTKSREVAIPLPKEILSVNEGVKDTGLDLDNLTTKELETINNTLEKEYSELHTKTIEDLTVENALEGVPEFVGETTIDGISSIFDLLNPYSDTFILKLAFVPSLSLADFFVDVKNLFFNQFPFIPQIILAFETLDGAFTPFSNYNTKPDDITIDLPSFAGGQTVTLLSFDLYSNYRDYIFMFIRAITWTYFISKTFKKVSFIFAKH